MVQYMVDQSVDAQILHQLKLIDRKCHKNPHVKSYAERIYASYERICKVLVTYPRLTFVNGKFTPEKDKLVEFMSQYSTDSSIDESTVLVILNIVNQALLYGIEATNDEISKSSAYFAVRVKEINYASYLKMLAVKIIQVT